MSIIVTGSIAYDHIMDFPGFFKDHILPEKIHILNVSFLVSSLKKMHGGCAPNISYTLALLGERSSILGTVGHDFQAYRAALEEVGVDTSLVKVIQDKVTASCFITTDKSGSQITGFYPGAMEHASEVRIEDANPQDIEICIVSPDDPRAMIEHVHECQQLKVPYIYDIGWQVIAFDGGALLDGVNGAKLVIGNDYELEILREKTGLTPEKMLETSEYVVITKGSEGSTIYSRSGIAQIPPIPAKVVLDPTGAGDAFRGGLLKGLRRGYDLDQMGRVAALAATFCVESSGTQGQKYTMTEFESRYHEYFGTPAMPLWEAEVLAK
ncbi:carbohydrate kinase family protein [Candidatus Chlorohelix sp.]|uniref:carbohydrate kinase family protein n=1 Tax=Candidatus Chlorohelix sp. TaxID=3139201 RepID=UPI00306F7043